MRVFNRNNKREIGSQYETLAKEYLSRQGLQYLESNYHSRFGEIDLIMSQENTLVFIEVKYRKSQQFGHAAEMVNYQKSQKLIKTAMVWLKRHGHTINNTSFRFDVIAIHQQGNDIEWIKNAITQG
ncbi:YraN family protein [Vibrio rumoiensis]|uniref:UPF0102 protein A1QC_01675 n=1 Tax=Vibrio rumoiensis 1S-45 TaxID=1188252 RepID=A0A1E5E1L4_9VIBR|nr:YraN family protein [Vibrio rumoiensis]OEF24989.1 YraN family protein [Vibrio rumoiensis 1S-45]